MNEEIVLKIWDKGRHVDGLSPEMFRMDSCGALMLFSKFGNHEDEYGWGIDHIYPIALGGDERLENLRPMQWRNLQSKATDFPVYFRSVKSENDHNVDNRGQCRVSPRIYDTLKEIYGFEE